MVKFSYIVVSHDFVKYRDENNFLCNYVGTFIEETIMEQRKEIADNLKLAAIIGGIVNEITI